MTVAEVVLKELRRWCDQRVTLSDRLFDDLCLDDVEQGEIALRLERALGRKPSPDAYRGVSTAADFVRVFEQAGS